MKYTSKALVKLITSLEGSRSTVYRDSAGLETIGVGHLIHHDSDPFLEKVIGRERIGPIRLGKESLSKTEVEELLTLDLMKTVVNVNKVGVYLVNQNQFDAVVSFIFNTGAAPLLPNKNFGSALAVGDMNKLAEVLLQYNKVTDIKTGAKIPIRGLTKRRYIEYFILKGALEEVDFDEVLGINSISDIKQAVLNYFIDLNNEISESGNPDNGGK